MANSKKEGFGGGNLNLMLLYQHYVFTPAAESFQII